MSYENLNCSATGRYNLPNSEYQDYYNASITYNKLVDAYIQNDCVSNNAAPFTITLTGNNYTSGSGSNITNTNCRVLGNNLVTFGNLINTQSVRWTTNVIEKRRPYDGIVREVDTRYTNVVNKRKELDENVRKIIGQENTPIYEKQAILDSAVYTTLLWTVLATSVLFYAFTKL